MPHWIRSALLAALACLALGAGLIGYLAEGRRVFLVASMPSIEALVGRHPFGPYGQWSPTFFHTLAFGLLTAAALPGRRVAQIAGCAAWGGVNIAFELGQQPVVSAWLAGILPASVFGLPVARYFTQGTFDPGDLLAAVLATATAIALLQLVAPRRHNAPS